MHQILYLFSAFPLGLILGLFYFGSLWLTVQQLPTTQWPVRLTLGSLYGRMAIVLLGFYLIIDGSWQRAIIGLLGLLVARTILTQKLKPRDHLKVD
jgi:F1F0 ATPase subunit 2